MAKISSLSLLGAAPADNDEFVILDVSDTTQGADGSTKTLAASRVARTGVANTFAAAQTIEPGVLDALNIVRASNSVGMRIGGSGTGVDANANVLWNFSELSLRLQISGRQGVAVLNSVLQPTADDIVNLGTGSFRFNDIFATNATIQTSDVNLKTDIENSDIGWDFIRTLRPVKYRWAEGTTTDPETGEEIVKPVGTRPHYGLIAQEVKAVMDAQGIADFAGYIYDEESGRHGLRYGELWGPLIAAIQRGADIIEAQQAQIEALTARVEALEAV